MLILFVLCLFTLPVWSSPLDLSITALSASSTELIDCNGSSSQSPAPETPSSSRVMNSTFLIRPPRVVISALSAFSRSPFKLLMSSGKRSDRSSQHNVALINSFPTSPETLSTVSSSISVGTGVVSAITDVCLFSSFTCCITSASNEALSVYGYANNRTLLGFVFNKKQKCFLVDLSSCSTPAT